jgi:hypothetical protein
MTNPSATRWLADDTPVDRGSAASGAVLLADTAGSDGAPGLAVALEQPDRAAAKPQQLLAISLVQQPYSKFDNLKGTLWIDSVSPSKIRQSFPADQTAPLQTWIMTNALKCPGCGGGMSRAHRRLLEKAVYSDAFACSRCKLRLGWYHPFFFWVLRQFRFVFSCYVRCGKQESVSRLEKRDYIDSVSKNPLALFQRLLRAPTTRCSPCRLQFYHSRPPLSCSNAQPAAPAGENPPAL